MALTVNEMPTITGENPASIKTHSFHIFSFIQEKKKKIKDKAANYNILRGKSKKYGERERDRKT